MTRPIKAFILAAGLGTRLKPLTFYLPKPLFPFCFPTLLDLAFWRIYDTDISEIALNSHYLPEKIRSHIKDCGLISNVNISYEKELLGTGGALGPLSDFFKGADVLIYNSDIISDADLNKLINAHQEADADATLLLLPNLLPNKNPVYCDGDKIVGIGQMPANDNQGKVTMHTFTGIHIVSEKFRKFAPQTGYWHITDVYKEALQKGLILKSCQHDGFWHDMGTPYEYLRAVTDFVKNYNKNLDQRLGISFLTKKLKSDVSLVTESTNNPSIKGNNMIPRNLKIPKTSQIGPNVIITKILPIPEGVSISNSLLIDEVMLKNNAAYTDSILFRDEIVIVNEE
ncbi:MAG: hypothetical protein HQK54_04195 [Oligoflexales bacterium]|nr:hypothetical protein [Oligoflexales bacterium]